MICSTSLCTKGEWYDPFHNFFITYSVITIDSFWVCEVKPTQKRLNSAIFLMASRGQLHRLLWLYWTLCKKGLCYLFITSVNSFEFMVSILYHALFHTALCLFCKWWSHLEENKWLRWLHFKATFWLTNHSQWVIPVQHSEVIEVKWRSDYIWIKSNRIAFHSPHVFRNMYF